MSEGENTNFSNDATDLFKVKPATVVKRLEETTGLDALNHGLPTTREPFLNISPEKVTLRQVAERAVAAPFQFMFLALYSYLQLSQEQQQKEESGSTGITQGQGKKILKAASYDLASTAIAVGAGVAKGVAGHNVGQGIWAAYLTKMTIGTQAPTIALAVQTGLKPPSSTLK